MSVNFTDLQHTTSHFGVDGSVRRWSVCYCGKLSYNWGASKGGFVPRSGVPLPAVGDQSRSLRSVTENVGSKQQLPINHSEADHQLCALNVVIQRVDRHT